MALRQDRLNSRLRMLNALAMLAGVLVVRASAGEFSDSFEGNDPSWKIDATGGATVHRHLRTEEVPAREGLRTELVTLISPHEGGTARLSHPLHPSRVFPELTLSLWLRSDHPGTVVTLRVIFPNEIDPATGRARFAEIRGDTYTTVGKWQQLRCVTSDKLIRDQIILQRALSKNSNLNYHGLYADSVGLAIPVGKGTTQILLDGLHFGPIAEIQPEAQITQVAGEATDSEPTVEVRGGRLVIDGVNTFPRILPMHNDSLDTLQQSGSNVIYVQNHEDTALLNDLRRRGMWAMAEPPCVISDTGKILDAKTAGIVPFSKDKSPILMWCMGTQIPAAMRQKVVAWNEQVRHADRSIRRPITGDVAENEQMFSRDFDLLSSSRHMLNTSFSFKDYRDWLVQKRQLANPWTYFWTWIQTEPVGANSHWREEEGKSPIVIEPEQIRLQVYAALSAGCRGYGFWKRTSLDGDTPGSEERRLIIQMLNLEVQLLEPLLATGVVSENVPFTVPVPAEPSTKRATIEAAHRRQGVQGIRQAAIARESEQQRIKNTNSELEAAIIKSQYGTMALLVWYETGAQFVPGMMAAYSPTLVVPGVEPSAYAWEVTPTSIRSVEKIERVPGGKKIVLKKIDQTGIVILSSDPRLHDMLDEKIKSIAPAYARAGLELAKAKLARVMTVDEQLQELAPDDRGGVIRNHLDNAQKLIDGAEQFLDRSDYENARQLSTDAMQLIRIAQRIRWEEATFKMSSPTSSPYTVSYQTLPDHWRMIAHLGRSDSDPSDNLIPSGDFEDEKTVLAEWPHFQNQVEGVRAAAELYPVAHEGRFSLRLVAVPDTGVDIPAVVANSPVMVTTPPVHVTAGQLVHIGGYVRVATPISASLDGVMLYDNLGGPVGALRWRDASDWKWFDMVREVRETGDLSLTLSLQGIGEAQFDGLRIVPIDPRSNTRPVSGTKDAANGRSDLLRLLNPWPIRRIRPDDTESPKAK